MHFDDTLYSTPWTVDVPLGPVPTGRDPLSPLPRFLTRPALGSFAPAEGGWQFEPSLPPELEIQSVLLLHGAYRICFTGGPVLSMIQAGEGVWVGEAPARVLPELFATDKPVETGGEFSHLDTGAWRVGLLQSRENGHRRIVLAVTDLPVAEVESLTRDLQRELGTGAELWAAELERRAAWCRRLPETDDPTLTGHCLEAIESCLEPARGPFSSLWIREPGFDGMRLDRLPGPIHALAACRPDTLRELMQTLADLPALPDGTWPLEIGPDTAAPRGPAAPPVLARQLVDLPKPLLPAPLRERLAKRCALQVHSFLGDGSPASNTLPDWPDASAALTPEICDAGLKLYDLGCLLVAEMEACADLSGDRDLFAEELRHMRKRLLERHWSPKRKALLDRTGDNDFAKRLTAGTLLPLTWKEPPKESVRALQSLFRGTEALRAPTGIRQWERRGEDPEDAPVRLSTQHLLFPALERLPTDISSLLSASWNRLIKQQAPGKAPSAACLHLRLLSMRREVNPELEHYPPWVRYMEHHRRGIVGVAAAVLLVAPILAGVVYMNRPELSRKEEYMEAGHAETLYTLRQYAEAEEVYTRLLETSRTSSRHASYYLKRGNARYHREEYGAAIKDYRRAVELDENRVLHSARWNLAQAYRQTGRREEALRVLRGFLEIYGGDLPSIRARAENAIALLSP